MCKSIGSFQMELIALPCMSGLTMWFKFSIPVGSSFILSILTMVDGDVDGVDDVMVELELPLQSNVGVVVCDLKSHPITSSMSIGPSFGDNISSVFDGK